MVKKSYLKGKHKPDLVLLVAIVILLAFGVLMVYDASVVTSLDLFGGQYHYLILQLSRFCLTAHPFQSEDSWRTKMDLSESLTDAGNSPARPV